MGFLKSSPNQIRISVGMEHINAIKADLEHDLPLFYSDLY